MESYRYRSILLCNTSTIQDQRYLCELLTVITLDSLEAHIFLHQSSCLLNFLLRKTHIFQLHNTRCLNSQISTLNSHSQYNKVKLIYFIRSQDIPQRIQFNRLHKFSQHTVQFFIYPTIFTC